MAWRYADCHVILVFMPLTSYSVHAPVPIYIILSTSLQLRPSRHTRGLLWARVFQSNIALLGKTLACQSG